MEMEDLDARLKDSFPAHALRDGASQRISVRTQAILIARQRRPGRPALRAGGLIAAAALGGGYWALSPRFEFARLLLRSERAEMSLQALQTISRTPNESSKMELQQPDLIAQKWAGGGRILILDEGTVWPDPALGVEVIKPLVEPKPFLTPLGWTAPSQGKPPSTLWKSRKRSSWITAFLTDRLKLESTLGGTIKATVNSGRLETVMTFRNDTGLLSMIEGRDTSHSMSAMPRMSPDWVKTQFLGFPAQARRVSIKEWCSMAAKKIIPMKPVRAQHQGEMSAAILGVWPVDENLAVKLVSYSGKPEGETGFQGLQQEMRAGAVSVRPLIRGISEAAGSRHLEAVFVPITLARQEFGYQLGSPLFSIHGWLGLSVGSSQWNWIHESVSLKGALAELKLRPPAQAIPGLQELLGRPSMKRHGEVRKEARALLQSLEEKQD